MNARTIEVATIQAGTIQAATTEGGPIGAPPIGGPTVMPAIGVARGRRTDPGERPGGRLPVSEFLFHRPGAASPFGEDLRFPLPAGALSYRHPSA